MALMNHTLSTEQRIRRQRVTAMRDDRFVAMAGIMNSGELIISAKSNMTAATNGRDEIYSSVFVGTLNDKQLRFLVLHEPYHKMLRHRALSKQMKNKQLANIAMDYVINGMLDNTAGKMADNFIEMPPGGCLDHKYDGMDTLQVYRLLEKEMEDGGGGGNGAPTDEHDFDGELDEMPTLDDEDEAELEKAIDTAIRQGAYMAGKLGGKQDRAMQDLLESRIPWPEELTDFVTTHSVGRDLSTWRKPSRRFLSRGVYMPSSYSESTERVTIGIDTSGSIDQHQITVFLSEAKVAIEAATPKIVDIIYWDGAVAGHEVYEDDAVHAFTESTKPKGGDGTRVGAMREYMVEKNIKPDCIIIFTDGYVESDWGTSNWPAPVMWAITTKGIVAPFGKSLRVQL